jgi:hypothetical protein
VAIGLCAAGAYALVRPHLIDDAYISFDYARNLAFHGQWALVEGHQANTATSPLWVVLLAAVTFVVRDAELAGGVLFVLCQIALLLALDRLGARAELPRWFAPLTVLVLMVNPLLVSSMGMEVTLGFAVTAWLLVCAAEHRALGVGVLSGALVLVRADLLVFALLIFLCRQGFWRRSWLSALAALVVASPWFVFSWLVLGSAVPDTLILKTLQKSWGDWDFGNGPSLYLEAFPGPMVFSFLPAALAVLFCLLWIVPVLRGVPAARRIVPFAVLGFAGAAHYLLYTWLSVPPYHWYFAPVLFAGTVFAVAAIATVHHRIVAGTGVLVVSAVAIGSMVVYALPGLPREEAPITTNHATPAQYRRIGPDVGRLAAGQPVRSAGEVGAIAYFCGCTLIDQFSDRGQMVAAIGEREKQVGTLGRWLLELNFRHFDFTLKPTKVHLEMTRVDGTPPPDALAGWPTTSSWVGPHHLYLVPVDS